MPPEFVAKLLLNSCIPFIHVSPIIIHAESTHRRGVERARSSLDSPAAKEREATDSCKWFEASLCTVATVCVMGTRVLVGTEEEPEGESLPWLSM